MTFRNHVKMMMMLLHVCINTELSQSLSWICLSMLNVSCVRALFYFDMSTYICCGVTRRGAGKKRIHHTQESFVSHTRSKSRFKRRKRKHLEKKCYEWSALKKGQKNIFKQRMKRSEENKKMNKNNNNNEIFIRIFVSILILLTEYALHTF